MEKLQIIVEGVSEEQLQRDIERCTRGWKIFFQEPLNASYEFFVPFWGYSWDGTPEDLRDIIVKGTRVGDRNKQHLAIFKYDGQDKFVWCSWTKELYDCGTRIKHPIEPKYAYNITEKIIELCEDF